MNNTPDISSPRITIPAFQVAIGVVTESCLSEEANNIGGVPFEILTASVFPEILKSIG